ncbi:phospholipase D-like protein [Prauserella shujinwangii]|uniref:Phospholipase D-like protein n=1 Tax=Prauserella shujinwangii TaxID=1453103 RepID=A0A2T0LR35_9PSEU|nr:PLDc N-terminal domain-containing protein [Prauserella shujinwangii]PRX45934.1 phospholipase D-like protein [Prauserella shujinwangii]
MESAKYRRLRDLSTAQRCLLAGLTAVQLGLASAAWADLARRDPADVRGPRRAWALAIAVNFAGPAAYFRFGRRTRDKEE